MCVFVCLVNIQRSDDIDSSLSASELVCTPVYPGSESIWPNEKAPHTHTNTLNPLDSSVSLRDGLCSHGGALLLPGGPGWTLTRYYVENISPSTEIA